MGGVVIGVRDGESGNERGEKSKQMFSCIAETGNDAIQIELASASAAGFAVAVGTEDALCHGLLVAVVLFAIDEPMGDQLAATCTLVTGESLLVAIEFEGEAMEGAEIREEQAHGARF